MKKLMSALLVLTMLLSLLVLTSCGEKTAEIALITDVGNIDDKSFNQGSWEGVVKYAKDHDIGYAYYRPTEDSGTAREETIKSAITKGAKVIVCPGYLFETAIFNLQASYPDTMFLLLDGEPNDGDYTHENGMPIYRTDSNVHCLLYQEEQAGYFAGYAAVKDGYKKLGFLGGMSVPAVIRYGYGFVQGVNAAADELGIAKDVSVNYWYSQVFAPNDEIQTKMNGWYSSGTEIVFACGGGIYSSAVAAAQANNGKVIGVDVDQSAESELIVTSAMKGLTNSVVLALTELYDAAAKNADGETVLAWPAELAGKTAKLGVADDCVGLPTAADSWRFTSFTVDAYNSLYSAVKNGTVTVSSAIDKAPEVAVTVDYQQ